MTTLVFIGDVVADITGKWNLSLLPHSTIVYDTEGPIRWFTVVENTQPNAVFKKILSTLNDREVPDEYKVKALLLT